MFRGIKLPLLVAIATLQVHLGLARRKTSSSETHKQRVNEADSSNESIASTLGCGFGYKPEIEHLHLDFPGNVIGKSNAVYLLLNPHTPTLVVHANSVWNFWREVDGDGNLAGDVVFDVRQPKGSGTLPPGLANQKFNLVRDMIGMKYIKGTKSIPSKIEFKYECKEAELRSKGRVRGQSRPNGSPRQRGRRTSGKNLLGSFLEKQGSSMKECTKEFTGGQYYDEKTVQAAMNKIRFGDLKAAVAAKNKDDLSDNIRRMVNEGKMNVSVTPSLAKRTLAATGGGAIGFFSIIPGVAIFADPGIIFGPLGLLLGIGTGLTLAKLMHKPKKSPEYFIFNKLWCLAERKTCSGKPCFTKCYDNLKNPYLVPYGKPCND